MAKVSNPPERIYLQVGDIDTDCDFSECERHEVTWCADKQFDTDIEYRLVRRQRSVKTTGRQAYVAHCDSSGIHPNRFPSWNELTAAEKEEWEIKATKTGGNNA